MKNFTNQRGLAILEVVIVAAIVAIFATAAVPKMARILDKAQLDYEMKHLYSTLELGRSISKSSSYNGGIFVGTSNIRNTNFSVYATGTDPQKLKYIYTLTLNDSSSISTIHRQRLPENFKLLSDISDRTIQISPDSGKSITFTLNSRLKQTAYVIGNSVGRWRGSYEK